MGTIDMLSALLLILLLADSEGQQNYYTHDSRTQGYSNTYLLKTGDSCSLPFRPPGVCTPVHKCGEVVKNTFQMPVFCAYQNYLPIACCPRDKVIPDKPQEAPECSPAPVADNLQVRISAAPPTTESFAALAQINEESRDFTAVGARSKRACQEYYQVVKSLKESSPDIMHDATYEDRRFVQPGARPHMALIGYGKKNKIYWRCSGSLISPRFVLSPGHCLATRRHGAAKWIMLGVVDPYDMSLPAHAQLLTIEERMPVNGFSPPSLHYDLAVLKLDRNAEFSLHVRPACISPVRPALGVVGTVPAWGLLNWIIEPGRSRLMEVTMEVIPDGACNNAYGSHSRLDGHYDTEHLLCVGNHQSMTTDCERDTGGPFHIQTQDDLFVISGVVLYGNTVCERRNNTPVITTDVASFLPWLEDTVWPEESSAQRTV